MDKTIRTNAQCIIGLPRCDFAFSSARSCFIGYSFERSCLEKDMIRKILEEHDIVPEDAGSSFEPGQLVFCRKICSKIITSQFCIILLNTEKKNDVEYANANVQMEYGLMLGFNKYVIPLQKQEDTLPFNIAGLDTIKYTQDNFAAMAGDAIARAVEETTPASASTVPIDQMKLAYLFSKHAHLIKISSDGEQSLYDMGSPVGFNLLMDFSGLEYRFFGDFALLRFEHICYRVDLLHKILVDRVASFPERIKNGMMDQKDLNMFVDIFENMEIWLLVNSQDVKEQVLSYIEAKKMKRTFDIFTIKDITDRSDLIG